MRRYIVFAFLLIALLTLVVWGISQFVQPILPGNLNNSLILLFAALLGVVAFLAGFKDVVELFHLVFQNPKITKNETSVPLTETNHSSKITISLESKDLNDQVENPLEESNFAQTKNVRIRMNRSFDDVQLDAFILDNFPEIYDRLSRGMQKDEKLTLLLDYCRRNQSLFELLISCLERAKQ